MSYTFIYLKWSDQDCFLRNSHPSFAGGLTNHILWLVQILQIVVFCLDNTCLKITDVRLIMAMSLPLSWPLI